ncbi:serine/threonine-protein kinase [Planomonospora sp. ID82291]|uniref:serine/threonine-protein kinase n=1 Tax=Planomonospora sp. ID82291 TaxID=2738136 RepID=UPI0018C38072|nr:serine/threonine-protein kinase [Planomonospora sp. ID82291]MBG0814231.1 serine/threonine protein kinase [Planomonospora sp. ID82291]
MTFGSDRIARRTRQAPAPSLSLGWVLAPFFCCGGAPIPFVIAYLAHRLRSRTLWIIAGGYLAVEAGVLAASSALENVPKEDGRWTITSFIWFGTCVAGTIQLLILRNKTAPGQPRMHAAPTAPPPPPPHLGHTSSGGTASPAGAGPSVGRGPSVGGGPSVSGGPSGGRGPSVGGGSSVLRWVGAYALLVKLGEGGQGAVYLARSPDGRQVALKLLHTPVAFGEEKGFLAEADSARRVPGFATARVLDLGIHDGMPYIVSEYVPGPSLEQLVRREGPRPPDSMIRLSIATAAALNGIHGAGVVHRDFKPANVLVAQDGPRVIDFGIARAIDRLTVSRGVAGTPAFMSPEQVEGRRVGPASDIFSWGVTMYFAATGRLPFGGRSSWAVADQIVNHHPDLRMLPVPLREAVAASLRKSAADRPSADRLLIELSR